MFFKGQLRVTVNITPQLDELSHSGCEGFAQIGHAVAGFRWIIEVAG
jgi:hypothetical protein